MSGWGSMPRWWTGVLREDQFRVLPDGGLSMAVQLVVNRQRGNLTPDREAYRNIEVSMPRAEVEALRDACDQALMPDSAGPDLIAVGKHRAGDLEYSADRWLVG